MVLPLTHPACLTRLGGSSCCLGRPTSAEGGSRGRRKQLALVNLPLFPLTSSSSLLLLETPFAPLRGMLMRRPKPPAHCPAPVCATRPPGVGHLEGNRNKTGSSLLPSALEWDPPSLLSLSVLQTKAKRRWTQAASPRRRKFRKGAWCLVNGGHFFL